MRDAGVKSISHYLYGLQSVSYVIIDETVRLKLFFFFLEESFSNNDKGFIVTGKSSTYRFDDIGELPSMNMTMMHMESQ